MSLSPAAWDKGVQAGAGPAKVVPVPMHPDQLAVEAETVRLLVADQFPAGAGLHVRPVPSKGRVNAPSLPTPRQRSWGAARAGVK